MKIKRKMEQHHSLSVCKANERLIVSSSRGPCGKAVGALSAWRGLGGRTRCRTPVWGLLAALLRIRGSLSRRVPSRTLEP